MAVRTLHGVSLIGWIAMYEKADSVSRWILEAKRGDAEALANLWQRYFDRVARVARHKLGGMRRRAADEEDVALSVFATFYRAAEEGRLPQVSNRDDLWYLLLSLTTQKAVDQIRHEQREKRGGGVLRGESALIAIGAVAGDGLPPEFPVIVAEECSRLLDLLDERLRRVAMNKMDGYTNEEIAERLDCSLSTVERSLRLIRKTWTKQEGSQQKAGSR